MTALPLAALFTLGLLLPPGLQGQPLADPGERRTPILVGLATQILFDPTTYAPTIIAYDAASRDWASSQVFFQHGYLERNPKFTASGLPTDLPLGYEAGRRVILKDALVHLQVSAVHNAASRSFEWMLIDRFPERRTLVRIVGWIERSVFASYLTYELSSQHYRQAGENARLAVTFSLP